MTEQEAIERMKTYETVSVAAIIVAAMAVTLAASYALAQAGEPSSYWLWHSVMGLI